MKGLRHSVRQRCYKTIGTVLGLYKLDFRLAYALFQITFKGRVPARNFEGSIHVDLPTPSQVYHFFCRVRWPAFSGF